MQPRGRRTGARRLLDETIVREAIRRAARDQGSIAALARSWHVAPSLLSSVIHGHRRVSTKMGKRLGFRKVVRWEREH